jgi:hypothetical protein
MKTCNLLLRVTQPEQSTAEGSTTEANVGVSAVAVTPQSKIVGVITRTDHFEQLADFQYLPTGGCPTRLEGSFLSDVIALASTRTTTNERHASSGAAQWLRATWEQSFIVPQSFSFVPQPLPYSFRMPASIRSQKYAAEAAEAGLLPTPNAGSDAPAPFTTSNPFAVSRAAHGEWSEA